MFLWRNLEFLSAIHGHCSNGVVVIIQADALTIPDLGCSHQQRRLYCSARMIPFFNVGCFGLQSYSVV